MVPFHQVPEDDAKEYQDVLNLAKDDLKELQAKKPKDFSGRFANSVTYTQTVYLGSSKGHHSLAAALNFFKNKKGQLKNLAINISGHGNTQVIGTSSILSISPEQLAQKISNYIEPIISPDVRLSFYLRSCNSAYVESQSKEEAAMEAKINTYSGKFCDSITMLRENTSQQISVSGYKGYLGVNKNNKLSVTKRFDEENYQRSEAAGNVRFVFCYDSSLKDIVVTVPTRYNLPVEGVHYQPLPINNYADDDSLSQSDSEDGISMNTVLVITIMITMKLLYDKLANKDKGQPENSFVSRLDQEVKAEEGRSY